MNERDEEVWQRRQRGESFRHIGRVPGMAVSSVSSFRKFFRQSCHHLLKTFWTGSSGWHDQQLPDGTEILATYLPVAGPCRRFESCRGTRVFTAQGLKPDGPLDLRLILSPQVGGQSIC